MQQTNETLDEFHLFLSKIGRELVNIHGIPKPSFTVNEILVKFRDFKRAVNGSIVEVEDIIIGGSLGLYLQGYDLGRPIGDLDLIFKINFRDCNLVKETINTLFFPARNSSDNMDFTLCIFFHGIKIDIRLDWLNIDTKQVFRSPFTYKVHNKNNILKYKMLYSQHNSKHIEDILKLIDKEPIYKFSFNTHV